MKKLLLVAMVLAVCGFAKKLPTGKGVNQPDPVKLYTLNEADAKNGETLFAKGNATGAAACVACHGAQGEGQAAAGFPRISGQSRMYVSEQLHHYKEGRRDNPVMMPIAKGLSDAEIEDLASYMETLPAAATPASTAKLSSVQMRRAQLIANVGDTKLGLQACVNCHGPDGMGQPPAIPSLRGQAALYTAAQLTAWRSGARKSSEDRMGVIAKLLTEDDVQLMAAYFEKLPSQKPVAQGKTGPTASKKQR